MLRKRLGTEAIESSWYMGKISSNYFKIPSTLTIPDCCEKIGFGVFKNCKNLKKVVIPESVESIGDRAFDWCVNATIILKKSRSEFKFILPLAFKYCRDVKEEIRS